MATPERLRIPLDEHRFENVGRFSDGTQFLAFVTGAFPAGMKYYSGDDWQSRKRWLAVLHRFDAEGSYIGTETHCGGFEIEGRDVAGDRAWEGLEQLYARWAAEGPPVFCDIWVQLFEVEIDGISHGLFYQEWEDGGQRFECVMLEPRDIMFHPPWGSGEYST